MSTIFVRNLPWSTTNDELKEFFESKLDRDVDSATVQFNKQGRSKGWALVSFPDEEGAQNAIQELNDADFTSGDNTRKLQIREDRGANGGAQGGGAGAARQPREPVEAEPSCSIFVGNLPWRTSWQDLKDIFKDYNVQYTTIKTGYDGRSRGYGIARFDTIEEAQKAIDGVNGTDYKNRTLNVRFDSRPRAPRPKAAAAADGEFQQQQEFQQNDGGNGGYQQF